MEKQNKILTTLVLIGVLVIAGIIIFNFYSNKEVESDELSEEQMGLIENLIMQEDPEILEKTSFSYAEKISGKSSQFRLFYVAPSSIPESLHVIIIVDLEKEEIISIEKATWEEEDIVPDEEIISCEVDEDCYLTFGVCNCDYPTQEECENKGGIWHQFVSCTAMGCPPPQPPCCGCPVKCIDGECEIIEEINLSECIKEKQEEFGPLGYYASGSIAIIFKENTTLEEAIALIESYNLIYENFFPSYIIVTIPEETEIEWICKFEENSIVEYGNLMVIGGTT